jgi:hypothetical protein
MPWKPWLLACLSALLLSCASASEPLLTVSLASGGPQLKRAAEIRGREYTVTVTHIGLDKVPSVRTRSGTMDKTEYRRLLERLDPLDLASYQDLYTPRDVQSLGGIITLSITYKGVSKSVTVVGLPPPELDPLLSPLLPWLDRLY